MGVKDVFVYLITQLITTHTEQFSVHYSVQMLFMFKTIKRHKQTVIEASYSHIDHNTNYFCINRTILLDFYLHIG